MIIVRCRKCKGIKQISGFSGEQINDIKKCKCGLKDESCLSCGNLLIECKCEVKE